ncbi:MAG: hypothetical protein FJ044_01675 [Candidatus Cloacimonetes bacterium]|nr:hypothetical protein [Candidatus Cloacimonadota bacterium]
MKIDADWFAIFSDLLINLAAGWFGAVIIIPNFAGLNRPLNFLILTVDVIFGMFSLVLAFRFKKLSKRND